MYAWIANNTDAHTWLAPVFAGIEDIGQLLFLIIASAVWVITEAARSRREKAEQAEEQAEARRQRRSDPLPSGPAPTDAEDTEQKTAKERAREIFEEVLGMPPRTAPKPPPAPTPKQPAPSGSESSPNPDYARYSGSNYSGSSERAGTKTVRPKRASQAPAPSSSGRAVVAHRPKNRRALQRLGITPGEPARAAARQAVLWYEVLGPPRAIRGPHRPPTRRNPGAPS